MRPTGTIRTDARRSLRRRSTALGGLWAGLAAATGLTVGIGARLRDVLDVGLAGAGIDTFVETGVLAIGVVLAAWLAVSVGVATACATGRVAGVTWRAGERAVARCAPQVVRRALVLAVGAGLGLSAATGATAAAPGDLDLGWTTTAATVSATPAPTTGAGPTAVPASAVATVVSAPAAAVVNAESATHPDDVVVAPGDTLWRIAQRTLPAGAGAGEIAATWPAWYAANAALIGDDPDLLQPGQVLSAPATSSDGRAS